MNNLEQIKIIQKISLLEDWVNNYDLGDKSLINDIRKFIDSANDLFKNGVIESFDDNIKYGMINSYNDKLDVFLKLFPNEMDNTKKL